jgi:hypothetical protein
MIKIRPVYWILGATIMLSACASALSDGNLPTPKPSTPESSGQAASLPETGSQLTNTPEPLPVPDEPPPLGAEIEFSTDFSKHSVGYSEILSGGPPKDGIPAIDEPKFIGVEEADEWLKPIEPVILIQVGEDTRAYPLQILIWHEIVNDTVGNLPLTVTFCPLCNTAIAFERTVNGQVLDFGTTGRLRYSNLIMLCRI